MVPVGWTLKFSDDDRWDFAKLGDFGIFTISSIPDVTVGLDEFHLKYAIVMLDDYIRESQLSLVTIDQTQRANHLGKPYLLSVFSGRSERAGFEAAQVRSLLPNTGGFVLFSSMSIAGASSGVLIDIATIRSSFWESHR